MVQLQNLLRRSVFILDKEYTCVWTMETNKNTMYAYINTFVH